MNDKIKWGPWAIGASIGIALILSILSGCSYLTVAPKPIVANAIAFDGNQQNAGLIDCDKDGCLVTSGWVKKYQALEFEFQHSIAADILILPEGNYYRISYEVANHFIDLQRFHRTAL